MIPKDDYIGDPGYPAPWTTSLPREGLRDTDEARIVCLAPDVCKSPSAPIPYMIVDFCGHDQGYTPSVRFTSQKAMVLRSQTTDAHGDAPGVGKGVKSGTVGGICEPIGHASNVRSEGSPVIRHLDRFHMNNRNTVGEALFVRDTRVYPAPRDDDPLPGSIVRVDASGAVVMSDAMPDPLIMGAQYAQAQEKPQFPPASPPEIRPVNPNTGVPQNLPPAANDNTYNRRGTFARPLPGAGLAGAAMALGELAKEYYPGSRLWRLNRGLAGQGIQINPDNPADLQALKNYSENLGGTSFVRRNLFPPMTEEEALAQLERELQAARQAEGQTDELAEPRPLAQPDTVRVDDRERRERPCLVGPYSEISKICDGEAHHIVPDMVYRLGRRPVTAAEMSSTDFRSPNAPTFNQGMSVCLTSEQHGSDETGLHGQLRTAFAGLQSPVSGTAPMADILEASRRSIDSIPGLPQACKDRAKTAAREQVTSTTGLAAPGRVRERPLPSGQARVVLNRGYY